MYDIKMLKAKKIAELIEIADQKGLKNLKGQKKQDINIKKKLKTWTK